LMEALLVILIVAFALSFKSYQKKIARDIELGKLAESKGWKPGKKLPHDWNALVKDFEKEYGWRENGARFDKADVEGWR
jgi:hypothetical protein